MNFSSLDNMEIEVRSWLEEGMTLRQLADKLKMSERNARMLLAHWGIGESAGRRKLPVTKPETAPIEESKAESESGVITIGQGKNAPSVKKVRLDSEKIQKKKERIISLLQNGSELSAIADFYGCNVPSLRSFVSLNGIKISDYREAAVKKKKVAEPLILEKIEEKEEIVIQDPVQELPEMAAEELPVVENESQIPDPEENRLDRAKMSIAVLMGLPPLKPVEIEGSRRAIFPRIPRASGSAKDAKHYQGTTQQPIEIMAEYLSLEEMTGFLRGNVVKYTLRAGRKDSMIADSQKAAQYAAWWAKWLECKDVAIFLNEIKAEVSE